MEHDPDRLWKRGNARRRNGPGNGDQTDLDDGPRIRRVRDKILGGVSAKTAPRGPARIVSDAIIKFDLVNSAKFLEARCPRPIHGTPGLSGSIGKPKLYLKLVIF